MRPTIPSLPMSPTSDRIQFAPRLVPTIAALVAFGLTGYLGQWQADRADEKRALQTHFDARAALPPLMLDAANSRLDALPSTYRQARAQGEYDASGQFYVDNKSDGAAVGYHVITPLKLNPKKILLVNRGFVPRAATYPAPPAIPVPAGMVVVAGPLVLPSQKFLELGSAAPIQGNVWQNLTVERYREHTRQDALPLVLLAQPTDVGLRPVVERPDAKVDKHTEYMLTWYSLAATVLALWLLLNLHFPKSKETR